jgi:hypothetical protein
MNLNVNFMALLIVYYSIIQLLQMERICVCVCVCVCVCSKCYSERDVSTYVIYVVFQSPTYRKALLSKHPFYIQLLLF